MDKECRDEITLVESDHLLDSLEIYLHKHRFDYYFSQSSSR